jgi:hypothetical protein
MRRDSRKTSGLNCCYSCMFYQKRNKVSWRLGLCLVLAQIPIASADSSISPIFTAGAVFADWDAASARLHVPMNWARDLATMLGSMPSSATREVCLNYVPASLVRAAGETSSGGAAHFLTSSAAARPVTPAANGGGNLAALASSPEIKAPVFRIEDPAAAGTAGEVCENSVATAWLNQKEVDFPVPRRQWGAVLGQLHDKRLSLSLALRSTGFALIVPTQAFISGALPAPGGELVQLLGAIENLTPNTGERDGLIAAALRPYGLAIYRGQSDLSKVVPSEVYESTQFQYGHGQFTALRTIRNTVQVLALLLTHPRSVAVGEKPVDEALNAEVEVVTHLSDVGYLGILGLDRTQTPEHADSVRGPQTVGACVLRYAHSVAYGHRCLKTPGWGTNESTLADASCALATSRDPDIYWDYESATSVGSVTFSFSPSEIESGTCIIMRYELRADGGAGRKLDEHVVDETADKPANLRTNAASTAALAPALRQEAWK